MMLCHAYLVLEEYLVTALVPSETACFASSPGRISRTDVWISRDEMVDFLLYAASLDASVATRSKMSFTKELRMDMARLEIPVSGWTCLRTGKDASVKAQKDQVTQTGFEIEMRLQSRMSWMRLTLVDVRGVGLLSGLGALLLVARWSGSLLAGLLLLSRSFASWCLAGGGWGLQEKTR